MRNLVDVRGIFVFLCLPRETFSVSAWDTFTFSSRGLFCLDFVSFIGELNVSVLYRWKLLIYFQRNLIRFLFLNSFFQVMSSLVLILSTWQQWSVCTVLMSSQLRRQITRWTWSIEKSMGRARTSKTNNPGSGLWTQSRLRFDAGCTRGHTPCRFSSSSSQHAPWLLLTFFCQINSSTACYLYTYRRLWVFFFRTISPTFSFIQNIIKYLFSNRYFILFYLN